MEEERTLAKELNKAEKKFVDGIANEALEFWDNEERWYYPLNINDLVKRMDKIHVDQYGEELDAAQRNHVYQVTYGWRRCGKVGWNCYREGDFWVVPPRDRVIVGESEKKRLEFYAENKGNENSVYVLREEVSRLNRLIRRLCRSHKDTISSKLFKENMALREKLEMVRSIFGEGGGDE